MRHYLDNRSMDDVAIERIRSFEAQALEMHPNGYWLAFSGGKDSVVLLDLAKRAGVKFEAHQSLCGGIDPPELVWFTKRNHPEVSLDRAPMTMWALIRKMQCPPLRQARYCCETMKERGGAGRLTVTGIRWAESTRRSTRKMTEACFRSSSKGKRYLHPIIDWDTQDVWAYIHEHNLAYCSLYDEGFDRVGCVLCPMVRDIVKHVTRWPRIARLWELAIEGIFNPANKSHASFATPQEYWQWWLNRDASGVSDEQPVLFEDDPTQV